MRTLALCSTLLFLLVQGCVSTISDHPVTDQWARSQKQYTLLGPLHVPQGEGAQGCGAQALAAAAAYVDPQFDPEELCKELPWGSTGATAPDILIAARMRGLTAKLQKGNWTALQNGVSANHPVLVLFDSRKTVHFLFFGGVRGGPAVYHWAVVSGYSAPDHLILLAAPDHRDYVLNQADFESRWNASSSCLIEINSGKDRAP